MKKIKELTTQNDANERKNHRKQVEELRQVSGIVTSNTLWCADKLILETILQDRNKKFRRRIVREINLSTHWFAGEGEIQDNTK